MGSPGFRDMTALELRSLGVVIDSVFGVWVEELPPTQRHLGDIEKFDRICVASAPEVIPTFNYLVSKGTHVRPLGDQNPHVIAWRKSAMPIVVQ